MAAGGKAVQPDVFILLDGLRGVGALMVVLGHTLPIWGGGWVTGGAVVVDLFFLLSGFVLAYAYEPRFKMGMRAGEFMVHRLVRLYPLYLLGTMVGFATLVVFTIGDADGGQRALGLTGQLIPQLFMLPAPPALGSEDLYPLNVPAWTLLVELAANLVYVLLFRWLSTRVLIGIVIAFGAAVVWRTLSFGGVDAGSTWGTINAGFIRAGFGFFAGVLAFRLLGSPTTARRRCSNWALLMLAGFAVFCFAPVSPQLKPLVELAFVLSGVGLIAIAQTVEPPEKFTRWFLIVGQLSYAIYILQQPLRELVDRIAWRSNVLSEIAPFGGIAVMASIVALAFVAERWFDRPVRRWIVRQLKARELRKEADRRAAAIFAE